MDFHREMKRGPQVVIGLRVEIVLKKLSDDTLVDFTQQRHER